MPDSPPTSAPFSEEKTFKAYSKEQGAAYAEARPGYLPHLYQTILERHTSTGGQLDTILDVGCGPGTAVRALAPTFAHAIGIDPSDGMVKSAQPLGGTTSTSEPIRYEISTAEELGSDISPPIPDSSVDLITAATAAHWFDMKRFWPSAARVLKPGGTVAIWAGTTLFIDPSMPNHTALQAAIDDLEEVYLRDYLEPGNQIVRSQYTTLALPWTLEQPVPEFDESTFFRKEWSSKVQPEDGEDAYFMGKQTVDMRIFEMILSTASPVSRWRKANPEAVGTENDVVRMARRRIEKLLHEAGVEEGKEVITGGAGGVLLMVKKVA